MVQALARGDTRAALDSLQERGRLHAAADREQAMQELVHDWDAARDAQQPERGLDARRHSRRYARAQSSGAREATRTRRAETRASGRVGQWSARDSPRGSNRHHAKRQTARHDEWGPRHRDRDHRAARRSRDHREARRRQIRTFAWSEHPHVEHGYALTAHKAQGASVERAYVLAHENCRRGNGPTSPAAVHARRCTSTPKATPRMTWSGSWAAATRKILRSTMRHRHRRRRRWRPCGKYRSSWSERGDYRRAGTASRSISATMSALISLRSSPKTPLTIMPPRTRMRVQSQG